MRKGQLMTAISAMLVAAGATAQDATRVNYYVTEFTLNPTSVSNNGTVVGGYGKDTPFIMWNPLGSEQPRVIGGMSAGDDGAAGPARISADGKTVIGSNWNENIEVPTTWERFVYGDFPFKYTSYKRGNDFNLFLSGYGDEEGVTRSYTLKSVNNGQSWTASYDLNFPKNRAQGAVTCMSCLTVQYYLLGTDEGKLYSSTGNPSWSPVELQAEDDDRVVKSFTAMDFARTDAPESAEYSYGAIGFKCEDGTFGTWYSVDSKYKLGTFRLSTGVAGVPAYITHVGETFYMVTANGHIQKSTDRCETWTDCYVAEGIGFRKIAFADADNGIAIADRLVLITSDGGEHWKVAVVEGGDVSPFDNGDDAQADEWNDVLWTDGMIALAGNNGRFYISSDNGKSFKKEIIEGADDDNFTVVMFDRNVFNLIADNGVFYRKTYEPSLEGYCPSRYDVETDTWTPMSLFGIVNDRNGGSTWGISPDARYAVGISNIFDSEVNKGMGYAAIWDENGNVTSLGTMFPGSATRANRVSYDGSVVVGFQDKLGPWMASVWRRQADGSYEHQLMFGDPETTVDDVDFDDFNSIMDNCLGNSLAVSQNGKWIGGTGGTWYAADNAWIWSEENGLEELDVDGSAVEVTEDGAMAVGRNDGGIGAWIWLRGKGHTELNNYVTQHGGDLNNTAICGFYAMSPNGRFLTGYAYDEAMQPHGYLIDLKPETDDIDRMTVDQVKAAVYPNPVVSELHVDLPYDGDTLKTSITLYNMQGGICRKLTDCRQSNVINVEGLSAGIYVLDVKAGKTHKTFKVIVK